MMDEKKIKTSIICPKVSCYLCGTTENLELHHALHGNGRRKLADEDKLFLALCAYHHRRLHDFGEYDQELKALAERSYIKKKISEGYTEGQARGMFLNRYGKHFDY